MLPCQIRYINRLFVDYAGKSFRSINSRRKKICFAAWVDVAITYVFGGKFLIPDLNDAYNFPVSPWRARRPPRHAASAAAISRTGSTPTAVIFH